MKWNMMSDCKPTDGEIVLIKLVETRKLRYYVCSYCGHDYYGQVVTSNQFIEASGEEYTTWDEEDVEAWVSLLELDLDFITSTFPSALG